MRSQFDANLNVSNTSGQALFCVVLCLSTAVESNLDSNQNIGGASTRSCHTSVVLTVVPRVDRFLLFNNRMRLKPTSVRTLDPLPQSNTQSSKTKSENAKNSRPTGLTSSTLLLLRVEASVRCQRCQGICPWWPCRSS